MKSRLASYLTRLLDTLLSRRELEVKEYAIWDRSGQPNRASEFSARVRFWDGSLLEIEETMVVGRITVTKRRYSYHYQDSQGELIFRYDNAPHHPELPDFPAHKHVGGQEKPEPAPAPDLADVLCEIDAILYPEGRLDAQ